MSRKSTAPLRLEWRSAAELQENPRNWRIHPQAQLEALDELIESVGWAGVILMNEATGRIIDGHARLRLRSGKDEKLPVLIGSWTEDKEKLILAALDPITSQAIVDSQRLSELIDELNLSEDTALKRLIEMTAGSASPDDDPPDEFQEVSDLTMEFTHACPKCGYKWSQ